MKMVRQAQLLAPGNFHKLTDTERQRLLDTLCPNLAPGEDYRPLFAMNLMLLKVKELCKKSTTEWLDLITPFGEGRHSAVVREWAALPLRKWCVARNNTPQQPKYRSIEMACVLQHSGVPRFCSHLSEAPCSSLILCGLLSLTSNSLRWLFRVSWGSSIAQRKAG